MDDDTKHELQRVLGHVEDLQDRVENLEEYIDAMHRLHGGSR